MNHLQDLDAQRGQDLAENIERVLSLIKEIERNIITGDPKERERLRHQKEQLRAELETYRREYAELTQGAPSRDQEQQFSEAFPEAWIAQMPHPIAVFTTGHF